MRRAGEAAREHSRAPHANNGCIFATECSVRTCSLHQLPHAAPASPTQLGQGRAAHAIQLPRAALVHSRVSHGAQVRAQLLQAGQAPHLVQQGAAVLAIAARGRSQGRHSRSWEAGRWPSHRARRGRGSRRALQLCCGGHTAVGRPPQARPRTDWQVGSTKNGHAAAHLSSEKLRAASWRCAMFCFHSHTQPRSRATAASSAVAHDVRLRGCGLEWPAQRAGPGAGGAGGARHVGGAGGRSKVLLPSSAAPPPSPSRLTPLAAAPARPSTPGRPLQHTGQAHRPKTAKLTFHQGTDHGPPGVQRDLSVPHQAHLQRGAHRGGLGEQRLRRGRKGAGRRGWHGERAGCIGAGRQEKQGSRSNVAIALQLSLLRHCLGPTLPSPAASASPNDAAGAATPSQTSAHSRTACRAGGRASQPHAAAGRRQRPRPFGHSAASQLRHQAVPPRCPGPGRACGAGAAG